jgi:hypothetical protein
MTKTHHRLAVSLLCLLATPAAAQAPGRPEATASKPAQIDRNGVLILVRSTLLALDHANKTGNYTVLRDLGAPGFQVNTDARLAEIFAKERTDNLDLSGVAAIDPQLTVLPEIAPNGMMHLAGLFPSVTSQVNFDLTYAPVNGQWRLFGIAVDIRPAGPAAPMTETPAAPPSATKQPPVAAKQQATPKPAPLPTGAAPK